MKIGKKIKKLRELKDITIKCVADELGLTVAGYGKIERDEVEVTLTKLKIIATILKMETNFIIEFDANTFLDIIQEREQLNILIKELKIKNQLLQEQNNKIISAISIK
jgi:transcriptional regulator with XRE-family HTH domain